VKPFSTPSFQEVPAELYLNLLKATWLLGNCQATRVYLVLDETSLWREYDICGLSKVRAPSLLRLFIYLSRAVLSVHPPTLRHQFPEVD
jgi:hypothetical protein